MTVAMHSLVPLPATIMMYAVKGSQLRMGQLARTFVSIALSLALIVLVQWSYGWHAMLQPWLSLSYSLIAAALVFTFASYALRAVRLWDYFRNDMRGHFGLSFTLMLQHNLLNNLLPMRTGEISFPVLMSRYFQVPMTLSVPALLWFRLLDLHVLALLAWIGIAHQWLEMPALLFIALLWLAIPAAVVLAARAWQRRLYGQSERPWRRRLQQLLASLPQDHSVSLRSWLWTALNWVVKLSAYAWIMLQFAPMSFYVAALGALGGDITSVLPLHGLAGAGTYEAGVVAALLPFGVSPSQSLVAAVNLHLFMLGAALLGGALSLVLPTLHTRKNNPVLDTMMVFNRVAIVGRGATGMKERRKIIDRRHEEPHEEFLHYCRRYTSDRRRNNISAELRNVENISYDLPLK